MLSKAGSRADAGKTTCLGRTGLPCDFTSPNNAKTCQVVGNEGFTYNIFQENNAAHLSSLALFQYENKNNINKITIFLHPKLFQKNFTHRFSYFLAFRIDR
jgi:hypothetical protein